MSNRHTFCRALYQQALYLVLANCRLDCQGSPLLTARKRLMLQRDPVAVVRYGPTCGQFQSALSRQPPRDYIMPPTCVE